MSAQEVVTRVLLWLGCGGLVLACVGAALLRDVRDRVHALSVAALVGVLPVAASLAISASSFRSAAKVVVIAGLLIVTAPVTSAMTGRALSGREGPSAQRARTGKRGLDE